MLSWDSPTFDFHFFLEKRPIPAKKGFFFPQKERLERNLSEAMPRRVCWRKKIDLISSLSFFDDDHKLVFAEMRIFFNVLSS